MLMRRGTPCGGLCCFCLAARRRAIRAHVRLSSDHASPRPVDGWGLDTSQRADAFATFTVTASPNARLVAPVKRCHQAALTRCSTGERPATSARRHPVLRCGGARPVPVDGGAIRPLETAGRAQGCRSWGSVLPGRRCCCRCGCDRGGPRGCAAASGGPADPQAAGQPRSRSCGLTSQLVHNASVDALFGVRRSHGLLHGLDR